MFTAKEWKPKTYLKFSPLGLRFYYTDMNIINTFQVQSIKKSNILNRPYFLSNDFDCFFNIFKIIYLPRKHLPLYFSVFSILNISISSSASPLFSSFPISNKKK